MIALLKLGVPWRDALDMPDQEGEALLMAFDEIVNPGKPRKMKVQRR